uniref:Deacetylase sirtuin-type domain-containing protein n=1 Tax=Clastoptera arizonana TaxID=38151 RepID=A0A1B6C5V1_9HEMI
MIFIAKVILLFHCVFIKGQNPPKYDFIRHVEPSNDTDLFRKLLKPARSILVINGPEITAASGLPTKPWDKWRGYSSESLDTLAAFNKSPALIWEYTQYRRDLVLAAKPNQAHKAIAEFEKYLRNEGCGRQLRVFTHNIDSLQTRAGSKNVVELEGSLFKTQCLSCGHVEENFDNPVCPALTARGSRLEGNYPDIPVNDLPHCKQPGCKGLLRPHIKFSDEKINSENIRKAGSLMHTTDFCILVGISTLDLKNPLGHIPPLLTMHNHTIAEFSLEKTYGPPGTSLAKFLFEGRCTQTLPDLLQYSV